MFRTPTRLALSIALAGALLQAAPALAGNDAQLNGKWQIVQMTRGKKTFPAPKGAKMIMHFKSSTHTWVFSIKLPKKKPRKENGTWTLKGDKLSTKKKGNSKVEKIRIKFKGRKKLEMIKQFPGGRTEKLLLKRV